MTSPDANLRGLASAPASNARRATRFSRAVIWLAWWVFGVAVLLDGAAVIFGFLSASYTPTGEVPHTIPFLLFLPAFLAFPAVGTIVVSRRPAHPIGWIFCTAGALGAAGLFGEGYWRYALVVHPGTLVLGASMLWLTRWVIPLNFGLALLALLLFPDGHLPHPRWRFVAWLVIIGTAVNVASQAFKPGPLTGSLPIANPFAVDRSAGVLHALENLSLVVIMVGLLAVAGATISRLRRSRGIERQQIKWLAYAGGVMAVSFSVSFIRQPQIARVAFSLGVLTWGLIPISTGVAILHYRLWDIDPIINRTLVYSVLTGSVIALYVLVVGGLGAIFHAAGNLTISLIATGLVAVLFQPLRDRLQRLINRVMYGERDDPYALLTRLDQRLEASIVADAVLPTIVETVAGALKLPYAAITLQQEGSGTVAAAHGRPVEPLLRLPLVYQNEPVGELLLAARAPGEWFSRADQRLLADVAHHAGVVAYGVRLTADLQRSRERLVTAREEERRRIRRDLHDGLGPQLASLTLTIAAARELLAHDPAATDGLLNELGQHVQVAIADIRRVIYALRPPVLDDLGLIAVLQEQAMHARRTGLRVSIQAPEQMPPLLAAVEVAAYRIVTEALTNVVRHAGARSCTIRLTLDAGLVVEVRDDGAGLAADRHAGIGLHAMRERAEELGGTCDIESVAGAGTRVHVWLPRGQEEA